LIVSPQYFNRFSSVAATVEIPPIKDRTLFHIRSPPKDHQPERILVTPIWAMRCRFSGRCSGFPQFLIDDAPSALSDDDEIRRKPSQEIERKFGIDARSR
jgi:hypothetical protein